MADATADTIARIDRIGRGKVNISFVYPPIPLRQFDWVATFDNDEPDDDGNWKYIGYGKTKIEALIDLLDNAEADIPLIDSSKQGGEG